MRIATALAFAVAVAATGCTTTTLVDGVPVKGPAPTAGAESDPQRRAAIRLQLASSYYQQRQFRFALEEVQRALQADPNLADAYGLLGLIYMELDDRREAEANFARALRLDPDNAELLNNYGWFLCRTDRQREAIPHFVRAAQNRLYATPALALQNAGLCLMMVRDFKAAEPLLRRSFELDATSPLAKYNLSRVYLALGELERASFYYGLLEATVDPSAESLWLGLRVARARGDVRTERQFADELRRRFPSSAEAASLRRGVFDD